MAVIEKEPSSLLLTVAIALVGGTDEGEQSEAVMTSREGQMGGHDRVSGSGEVRPFIMEVAMAPKLETKCDVAERGEKEVADVAFANVASPLEMASAA